MYVVYLNAAYLAFCFGAVTMDFTIRIADPDRYCLKSEGVDVCDAIWDQLWIVWITFALIAVLWLLALKRMMIYAF